MEFPAGRGLGYVLAAFCFLLVLQSIRENASAPGVISEKAAGSEQHALEVLEQSSYEDFRPSSSKWLNITGLEKESPFSWHRLWLAQLQARMQVGVAVSSTQIDTAPRRTMSLDFGESFRDYESVERFNSGSSFPDIPFYQNITGHVHGDWVRSKFRLEDYQQGAEPLPDQHNSSSPYFIHDLAHNVTGSKGRISLRLSDRQQVSVQTGNNTARLLEANLNLEDQSGDSWYVPLRGIHFLEIGAAILATSSDKFVGLYALPHLATTDQQFEVSKKLLSRTASQNSTTDGKRVLTGGDLFDTTILEDDDDMFPTPKCEYVVYLQQHLVWPYAESRLPTRSSADNHEHVVRQSYLEWLEKDLRMPSGAIRNFVPPLRFSATIFSPDCGFILESTRGASPYGSAARHLSGQKIEVYLSDLKIHTMIFASAIFLQVFLLTRQIKDSSTPSTRSRISYNTIGIMVSGDVGIFATALLFSAFIRGAELSLLTLSFLQLLGMFFFGFKFMIEIWVIQAPEREEHERIRLATRRADATVTSVASPPASITPAVIITPAGADLLPLPATAPRYVDTGATTVILPPDQDLDAAFAEDQLLMEETQTQTPGNVRRRSFNVGLRFLLLAMAFTMLSAIASSWTRPVRSVYIFSVLLCYLSFWIPQIRRNMLRNCRKGFRWEFVFGQSITRLVPVAYFYLYGDPTQSDIYSFWFFVAWQWAQILLLLSQDVLGPRFFVPGGILPPAYDYHQVLREGDEEDPGLMPVGSTQDGLSESKEKGKWVSDCIICMHPLEVSYAPRDSDQGKQPGSAAVTNVFGRRDYMITPCRHIFHSQCLDGWMKYKLQCPICRESLPPL